MLGKIIKHEFKATWKYIAVIAGIFTLALVIMRLTLGAYVTNDNFFMSFLGGIFFVIVMLAVLASMVIFAFAPAVINIVRFYKTTVTDRGYLTHTLPVSTDKLIIGKLIVASLWQLICVLYAALAFIIMILSFDLLDAFFLTNELYKAINLIFTSDPITVTSAIILVVLSSLVSVVSEVLKYYSAMSIGQCFNRNKLLFSILVYVGFSIIYSIVTSSFGMSYAVTLNLTSYTPDAMEIFLGIMQSVLVPISKLVVFDLFIAAIYYILTRYFLKNKLNLS